MSDPRARGQDMDDAVIPFQVGPSSIRGRLVKLGAGIDTVLTRHSFPHPLSQLLGEATALVAMLGASLKFDGRLILQMQGDGPVSMLVADYTSGGAIRATATMREGDDARIRAAKGPELHYLLQKGHMVVTMDPKGDQDRHQGITALEGATLSKAMQAYFDRSEQIPTRLFLAVGEVIDGESTDARWRAGGLMVQYVPGEGGTGHRGEEGLFAQEDKAAWQAACALMATATPDEILDPALPPQELLYRLFHEEGVRVFPPSPVHFACGCSEEKIRAVLDQYGEADLADLAVNGKIEVTCDFCREVYYFDPPP